MIGIRIEANKDPMVNILIGNSYPLSLIRRKVIIEPAELTLGSHRIFSFWGHKNTLEAAGKFIGADLTPNENRPVIKLSDNMLPTYCGHVFEQCWIISPVYKETFRPKIGEEVDFSHISSWQTLKITWEQ